MGAPMAATLLRSGFILSVYNRTTARCGPLVELGARACETLGELGAASDVVITMVSDTPDVEAILFGSGGLAASLAPGAVIIDMSTIAPAAAVRFAKLLAERSVAMLDAPVSGGEAGARSGTLSIMVGGERAVFERILPVLNAMGTSVVHAGPAGRGQMTKLINQIATSLNLLAAVEVVRVARAAGLNVEDTLRVICGGAGASWLLTNLGPKIAAEDFAPGFRIRLQDKDLQLARAFAGGLGVETPGLALAASLFRRALEYGLGELGNHGLYRLWD
ncbi:MAG: tartronate semialdehyde reductase [Bryobacterales bacterium]|nr:tartronate semialdehyde reductase [Bryobacterales bacterium]